MIATRNGVRCGVPSAPVTAISLATMVHGLKIGWPSRVENTLLSTSGKSGPAHFSVVPPSTFIGVPVTCDRKPRP